MAPTGNTSPDGNPEFIYDQAHAIFYGVDLDNKNELKTFENGVLSLLNKFDYVRAKNTTNGKNLPRISPARFSTGFEFKTDKWTSDIESQYVAHQTKVAPNETRTKDYILTNIGYTYHMVGAISSLDLFVRVRNIFDVEARSHVSTLKEIAPLPGRNFIVGAQFQI